MCVNHSHSQLSSRLYSIHGKIGKTSSVGKVWSHFKYVKFEFDFSEHHKFEFCHNEILLKLVKEFQSKVEPEDICVGENKI